MEVKSSPNRGPGRHQRAFTLTEVMVGVALMAMAFVSLYLGLSTCFGLTTVTRENLRATQILLERMEGIRLYNWDQLQDTALLPRTFTNYFYPLATGSQSKGITYTGSVSVVTATLNPPSTYSSDVKKITVAIGWTSGKVHRLRQMSTFCARNGAQNYIYSQ